MIYDMLCSRSERSFSLDVQSRHVTVAEAEKRRKERTRRARRRAAETLKLRREERVPADHDDDSADQ